MILRKFGTRGGRIIAAIICALGIAIPAWAATPAANASSVCTPIHDGPNHWTIPWGCAPQVVPNSQVCAPIASEYAGTAYEYANECVAIWAGTSSGRTGLWGVGTFSCSGPYTQCAGMNVSVDLSTKDSYPIAQTVSPGHYVCNPSPGPACPGAAGATVSSAHADVGAGDCEMTQAWDPYDGWNGNHQVIALKPDGYGWHSTFAVNSANDNVCLAPAS